jgi:hypothetical protein
MYLINSLFAVLVILISTSCANIKSDELSVHIKNLKKINTAIDSTGWNFWESWDADNLLRYAIINDMHEDGSSLVFYIQKDNNKYSIESYTKIFKEGPFQYTLYMEKDTVFYFKEPLDKITKINKLGNKQFIRGRYAYLDRFVMLRNGQERFYSVYKDSLSQIEGNELPELPELEERDYSWLEYLKD